MANNDSSLVISLETLNCPYVISKELHSILSSVSKLEPIATLHEILEGLKIYIMRKKLFSPLDPSKIVCKTDELRSVFGVSEFSVQDLRKIIQKLIVPEVNHISSFSQNSGAKGDGAIKRTSNGDLVKDDESVVAKRFCDPNGSQQNFVSSSSPSKMFLYIPPTPERCDFSDLPESIQGYETEYVKDSSDISFWSDSENDFFSNTGETVATADVFDIEYEVEYSSEHTALPSGTDTDDEEVILNTAAIISVLQKPDSDFEFWADASSEGEEDDDDDDVEIPVSDRWLCRTCGSLNKPPMRYCLACFDQRAGWLPEKRKDYELWKMAFRKKRQTARDKYRSRNPHAKSSEHHSEDSSNSFESKDSDFSAESPSFFNSSQETVDSLGMSQGTSASSLLNGISSSCPSLQTSGFESSQTETTHDSAGLSQGSSLSLSQNDYNSSNPSLQSNDFLSSSRSADYFVQISGGKSISSSELGACSSSPLEAFSILNSYDDCNYPSSQERLNDPKNLRISLSQKGNAELNISPSEKLCIICCSSPALGSIIHGKFAHQATCYRCARTLQKQKKRCPICRRNIQKVVHQIV
ncbi:E3 ubiquitin-protein ligase Mdm2-like [Uloborus diversus]|uniref:E3 ubiquitin-protein ligase Mdm2-like n=1 Tax=Uloborus diversus TaxID=327109 RepID=UPI00240A449C|nr:E3 ubiquitin-protein ligase Mdm2-like [Uloborus diversus]